MCSIMLANTLTTDYRHFFDWKQQTFAYLTVEKPMSARFDRLKVYWNQSKYLRRDGWDTLFWQNNFTYFSEYNQTTA